METFLPFQRSAIELLISFDMNGNSATLFSEQDHKAGERQIKRPKKSPEIRFSVLMEFEILAITLSDW